MSGHMRERLSAYLDGELHGGERALVEAHLGGCPECTAFLADLAAVDEAAAALPAEAPEGYFESFPARVRARLGPREAAPPARRVPQWTWAVAAALLLAVVAPLTLRQARPRAIPPDPAPIGADAPAAVLPDSSQAARAYPSARPTPSPGAPLSAPAIVLPPATPPPAATPPAAPQARKAPPPAGEAAPHESSRDAASPSAQDEADANLFAQSPAAPVPREEVEARKEAPAGAESESVAGMAAPEDAARSQKRAGAAARAGASAEGASPALGAAGARLEPAPASLDQSAEAFHRLEAARPRTAAGWRLLREQWSALAAADADPARADEARVRAIVAAREAWRAGGEERDLAAFREEAASYLRRHDARQRQRVERLLAER